MGRNIYEQRTKEMQVEQVEVARRKSKDALVDAIAKNCDYLGKFFIARKQGFFYDNQDKRLISATDAKYLEEEGHFWTIEDVSLDEANEYIKQSYKSHNSMMRAHAYAAGAIASLAIVKDSILPIAILGGITICDGIKGFFHRSKAEKIFKYKTGYNCFTKPSARDILKDKFG